MVVVVVVVVVWWWVGDFYLFYGFVCLFVVLFVCFLLTKIISKQGS